MVEHQRAHAGVAGGLRRLGDVGVIVDHVAKALDRHLLDHLAADHRLDVDVGALAQGREAGAGHGVAGDHHHLAFGLNAKADRRVHRAVVGRRRHDADAVGFPGETLGDLGDIHFGPVWQVGVMRHAVVDVVFEHRQRRVGELLEPHRPDRRQWPWVGVGDPARRDDVVVVGGVIAVHMGDEHRRKLARRHADGDAAHQHGTAAIEQQVGLADAHQRGRAGPIGGNHG